MSADTLAARWAPLELHGSSLLPDAEGQTESTAPTDRSQVPEWLLARLYGRLVKRLPSIKILDDYYCGNHPLPWLPEAARDEFRNILRMTRTNYMGLVIDAQVERMNPQGIYVGDDNDDELWRIYQANNLDAYLPMGFLEATKLGEAYLLAGPNAADPSTPIVSVEHPSQAIVETAPHNRRIRRAGLKVHVDDWTAELIAQIYHPQFVANFRAKVTKSGGTPVWKRDGEVQANPAGMVPLVPLPNNPGLLTGGVSEIIDVLDPQDRVNKTVADRLITQDYGAFPQWNASGYPEGSDPIRTGRNRMITSSAAETKFGQFMPAAMDPYSLAKKEDVKDIASRTRTPAQYLLSGDFSNVNGETLQASESGLVTKVRSRIRPHSEGIEDAMRVVAHLSGRTLPSAGVRMWVDWRDPQFRTEGELVDALVKMRSLGTPLDVIWERWGATPQERDRWRELLAKEQRAEAAVGVQAIRDAAAGGF